MHELAAIAVLAVLYFLPWGNPYLIGVYLLLSFGAMLYLSMAIVHRTVVRKQISHRMADPENWEYYQRITRELTEAEQEREREQG